MKRDSETEEREREQTREMKHQNQDNKLRHGENAEVHGSESAVPERHWWVTAKHHMGLITASDGTADVILKEDVSN